MSISSNNCLGFSKCTTAFNLRLLSQLCFPCDVHTDRPNGGCAVLWHRHIYARLNIVKIMSKRIGYVAVKMKILPPVDTVDTVVCRTVYINETKLKMNLPIPIL